MAEPQKQQMGDGSDNIGQAAGQAAKAAKNAGKQAAKQAAKKGAEAAANAAAATVKAGVEGGKAVAEIAAGTAAGGPWGAIISAAWAMRHTLFKILVCLCLSVVFLIVMIVELPGIIINKALGIDGNEPTVSITDIYESLAETVSDIVQAGYDASMAEVERLISDGGYDRELSMNALINYAQSSAGYDTAYILSAYAIAWPVVDFAALESINSDCVAWIRIDGTEIDYPVVQGHDNSFYLKHLFDGEWNGAGCIFLDSRVNPDLSDRHSVLYGHHMKNGTMFSDIAKYKDQTFYENHTTGMILTPTENYRIEFFAGYVAGADDENAWKVTFATEDEYVDWLNETVGRSWFKSEVIPTAEDRVITLSTCSYEFNNARFVLIGRLK